MNLQLPLTTQWFEMTKSGEKIEDYRIIDNYFCNRFLLYKGEIKSNSWWKCNYTNWTIKSSMIQNLKKGLELGDITFKPFATNVMTLGYPKKTDLSKRLKYKHEGIEIREGNPKWGAEKGKLYFVIKHGELI